MEALSDPFVLFCIGFIMLCVFLRKRNDDDF